MFDSTTRSGEIIKPEGGDWTPRLISLYDDVMFDIAEQLAERATCPRKSVGCVLVNETGYLLGQGWNGATYNVPTCMEDGCILEGGHCVRSVHAEIRAIAAASTRGLPLIGAIAYSTLLPCIQCLSALRTCGIQTVFYDEVYARDEKKALFRLARQGGIALLERIRS